MIIGQEEVVAVARTTAGEPPPELDHIYRFAAKLVRTMRPEGDSAPAWPKPLVSWGAGPRAVLMRGSGSTRGGHREP